MKIKEVKSRIIIIVLIVIMFNTKTVLADTIIATHNFEFLLAAGGDSRTIMDTDNKMTAGYVKVDIETTRGDTYDVRLKYSKNLLRSNKTFAVKKGIKANEESKTIYFIPKKGKCPGKNDECVRVPVIKGISTNTKLIDSKRVIYGIEVYNGSVFGGTMKVKGSFSFINYDETQEPDEVQPIN